ncbi:hypothetical protein HanIR_Chr12g0587211 [Helianthus annuus]|nr:hypothetical protein HanIR_Chr12g0587211 [Helianthus annuus]
MSSFHSISYFINNRKIEYYIFHTKNKRENNKNKDSKNTKAYLQSWIKFFDQISHKNKTHEYMTPPPP